MFALGALKPGTAYMTLLVVFIFIGTLFLTGRQLLYITANLTVNEMINRKRYVYLKSMDGSYWNPFDEGPLHNCLAFWSGPDTNWYAKYSSRKDADPVVESAPWTGNGILRYFDSLSEALIQRRIRRQREREDRLLQLAAGRPRHMPLDIEQVTDTGDSNENHIKQNVT